MPTAAAPPDSSIMPAGVCAHDEAGCASASARPIPNSAKDLRMSYPFYGLVDGNFGANRIATRSAATSTSLELAAFTYQHLASVASGELNCTRVRSRSRNNTGRLYFGRKLVSP